MAIDRKKVIEYLSQFELLGDETGLIPAYGVFIQQLPSSLWNLFAERLTRAVPKELRETAEWLLIDAAHECGYHTGYGIITSEEWKAVVAPMVEKVPEDILYGAFAVFSAWGWANAEIEELIPGEKMIIRAYNYYEADVVDYGESDKMSAYTLSGVSAAFMDLAYGGPYDPTGATGLNTFTCKQVKGIECGDPYGEFIVTRAK
ncbi:hypothetical protein AGMMS49546_18150 [Spirochaetia bacterium]|nr:hypothetical protein AGMMS49546_18150 [Spirochaetia bacterium]